MIPLLFAAALQSEIVLQTNVFEKFSCGAGCHKKVEQLTNMVEIGDGWRKIKVKHTPYIWTREGGLEQRAPVFDSPIGTGGTTSWNYSNCKTNIFTNRRREYFAAPPAPDANRGERNLSAFTSSGSCTFPSAVPVSSPVLLALRCTAGVAYCSPSQASAIVPATD